MIKDTGTLFDDGVMSAEVQMQFQGNLAKMQIRYQNKSASPIDSLHIIIAPVPYLQLQDSGTPKALPPHGAHPQLLSLRILDYFSDPPRLQINYSSGGKPVCVDTKLPLSICKFLAPVQCTKDQYFGVWNKITGAPNEVSQVLKGTGAVSASELESCIKGLRFSLVSGIDPNPKSYCGACRLNIGHGDVFGVLRVETQPAPQAYKITIKTSNPTVTAVTRQILADFVTQ